MREMLSSSRASICENGGHGPVVLVLVFATIGSVFMNHVEEHLRDARSGWDL